VIILKFYLIRAFVEAGQNKIGNGNPGKNNAGNPPPKEKQPTLIRHHFKRCLPEPHLLEIISSNVEIRNSY